ncbi:hypothetical protein D3C87_1588030 [compost metagenome]
MGTPCTLMKTTQRKIQAAPSIVSANTAEGSGAASARAGRCNSAIMQKPVMTAPARLRRQMGNSANSRKAASNDGSAPNRPSAAQAPAPTAIRITAVRLSPRKHATGKAFMPPGSQRPTRNMAPSAPSQAVKAKFTGRNAVCHKGRERSTMTSAPV